MPFTIRTPRRRASPGTRRAATSRRHRARKRSSRTTRAAESYSPGRVPAWSTDLNRWLQHPGENFGWLVQGDETRGQSAKRFNSHESTEPPNMPPQLEIAFAPLVGGRLQRRRPRRRGGLHGVAEQSRRIGWAGERNSHAGVGDRGGLRRLESELCGQWGRIGRRGHGAGAGGPLAGGRRLDFGAGRASSAFCLDICNSEELSNEVENLDHSGRLGSRSRRRAALAGTVSLNPSRDNTLIEQTNPNCAAQQRARATSSWAELAKAETSAFAAG